MKVSLRLKSAIYTFIKQRFISDMGTKQDKTVDRNASINSVKYQFSVLWRGLNTTCLRDSFDSDTKFWNQKHSRDSKFRDHLSEYKLYVCVLSHFSCVWLFATLCTPWGSSVHGVLQARILEWVAISFSRGSSQPRVQTSISWSSRQVFCCWATREALFPRPCELWSRLSWSLLEIPLWGKSVPML